jgi:hypothetical protein
MTGLQRKLSTTVILVLVCCLLTGCGSDRKTGTVTGEVFADGQISEVVELEDGSQVRALPGEVFKNRITGPDTATAVGQRVEVEPLDSNYWKVVRMLDSGK